MTDFSLVKINPLLHCDCCGVRVCYVFPVVCNLFSHRGTSKNDSIHRVTGCTNTRLLHRRQQAEGILNPPSPSQAEEIEIYAPVPSWLFIRNKGWKALIIALLFLVITQFPVILLYSSYCEICV